MNVQIRTAYGEMSFDMPQDKVLSLISTAISYANEYENQEPTAILSDAIAENDEAKTKTEELASAPTMEKKSPKSRLETLFGNKTEWNLPADTSAEKPAKAPENVSDEEQESYKGFLYIECEKCGALKGFCVKHPLTYHKCECGHETRLRGLRPAHVKCECNSQFRYHTNIQRDAFTIECLHCGSPVDMELDGKGTAFVSVAFSDMYKQKGRGKNEPKRKH